MQTTVKDEFMNGVIPTLAAPARAATDAIATLTKHWPEYLMEIASLGLFMISACSFTVLLQHPDSALRQMLPGDFERRLLTGLAMGLTAVALIYSPWGKQSGAHLKRAARPLRQAPSPE